MAFFRAPPAEEGRTTPPPQPVLFSLYDEEPSGRRPASLAEPPAPQEGVPRHTMEQSGELAPMVQILDAPVLQLVEKLEDVLKIVDLPVPEQEIDVPKISCLSRPPLRRALPVPQLAEQLVVVPVPEAVFFWHAAGAHQASFGTTLLRGEGGATGGWVALATSSGSARRCSPPAQGGK